MARLLLHFFLLWFFEELKVDVEHLNLVKTSEARPLEVVMCDQEGVCIKQHGFNLDDVIDIERVKEVRSRMVHTLEYL